MTDSSDQRRRRLDEVFGDVLPATTNDERDPGDPAERERGRDSELLADRPPHHERDQ